MGRPMTPRSWIFENDAILVLNKPSGLPSARLPKSPPDEVTAVDWALERFPEIHGVGFSEHEAGLVHRLDTGTSGLLVFAKTQKSFEHLRGIWERREVRKIYRAICVPNAEATPIPDRITLPLAHHVKSAKKMICILPGKEHYKYRGKLLPAETIILHKEKLKNHPQDVLDITLEIKTGVMHQIRCHLAELDHPILGDSIYGGQPSTRLWLHAWRLELDGLILEAPLPEKWAC